MVALEITAPCSSVIMPLIEPVGFCAPTVRAVSATSVRVPIASSKCLRLYRITVSPFKYLRTCERKCDLARARRLRNQTNQSYPELPGTYGKRPKSMNRNPNERKSQIRQDQPLLSPKDNLFGILHLERITFGSATES